MVHFVPAEAADDMIPHAWRTVKKGRPTGRP
jgi:hypothetical protein